MLTIYRRHREECPQREKPRHVINKCDCPIWGQGFAGGRRFRQSLQTVNIDRARRRGEVLEEELASGRVRKPVGEAVEAFLSDRGQDVRGTSLKRYRRTLEPLSRFAVANDIDALTRGPLSAWTLSNRGVVLPRTHGARSL